MKIIDLLNKIANGEYPDFKYYGGIYKYNKKLEKYLYGDMWFNFNSFENRNDEVEILEEEKKIPEKLSTWFSLEKDCENDNIQYANINFDNMYEKINEICDYLKSKGDK